MAEGTSLVNIDLGNLSKPATILIKKVSNAVGILYEPMRIVKKAKAEADAEKIKALTSIEISEIQTRGLARLVHQEGRKQENIERITAQAIESLQHDANVEELEEDWIAYFFKNCDTVSDKEMQSLWAKLLAGEASRPGTFSKRTVDFVASMDKSDAKLFTDLCQFCFFLRNTVPVIFDYANEIYTKHGINFESLKHLGSIGLISFEVNGYLEDKIPKKFQVTYFGQQVVIEFPNEAENKLEVGNVLLTQAGQELFPICGAARNDEFFEYALSHWSNQGLIISSPDPRTSA